VARREAYGVVALHAQAATSLKITRKEGLLKASKEISLTSVMAEGRERFLTTSLLTRRNGIGGWLSQLSREQITDAFRAANYNPEEVEILTDAVRDRIDQLVNLPSIPSVARR